MYIITGGAGMIGSAMLWKLNSLGIDDVIVVDNLGVSEKWKNLINRRFEEYVPRDAFLERVQNNALPAGIKGIFHMGACSSTTERDIDFLFRNNLEYTKTLARYACEKGIRFINASSAATYGDGAQGFSDEESALENLKPLNGYGFSKHLFDLWAKRNDLQRSFVSLKFFNVYGPNEYHKGDMRSVAAKAFIQANETGHVRLFASDNPQYPNGGQMRDFVYVKDCVETMWNLMETPSANGVYNLGSGKARTWNDLARALFKALGKEERIEYVPLPDHLHGKYQYFTEADMGKLAQTGCAAPQRSLEEGVADYVANYLQKADPHL